MDKVAKILEMANTYQLICEAKKLKKIKKTFGPYTRSDGRSIVIVHYLDGSKRTISYPKHIMEQHLQKELDPDKGTVDHLNFDINDNRLENLRIVPRDQHSADDTRRVKLIKIKCSNCKKVFERSPRILRDKSKKGCHSGFCSRHCAGQYSRAVQLGKIKRLKKTLPVTSEYYRRKNVMAIFQYFIGKYGQCDVI